MNKRKSLRERTFELLRERPRNITLQQIADESGISFGWLGDFSAGRGKHISCDKVQTLYEYLTGELLEY